MTLGPRIPYPKDALRPSITVKDLIVLPLLSFLTAVSVGYIVRSQG